MKKYDKIKRIGHTENDGILESHFAKIWIQEKMDGANFRFTLDRNLDPEYQIKERKLVFGSRNVEYKNESDVDSAFQHAIDYVRENVNVARLLMLDSEHGPLTFFGEAMHPHTLDYDWDETPSFLGFDVYSHSKDEFCRPDEMAEFYEYIGLPTVPYVSSTRIEDGLDIPDSVYHDGVAEGIVIKNIETNQMAKVRSEKFKEMHGGHGGKTPEEYEPEDAIVLANQFATEARILKQIQKYKDREKDVNMSIMEELWRDVFDDIIEEEYQTIFLGNHTINTKDFRSEVAGNTAEVLQRYLSRPDGSALNEVAT